MDSLDLEVLINTTPEKLYKAWMDSKQHTSFTGSKAFIDPNEGGNFGQSFEAVGDQGEIRIKTKDQGESKIKLEFVDNGVGITSDDIPHIFEPFFSAKNKSTGIGLGLAIVHGIIQGHNGKIKVQSDPGIKTTVSITLPLVKN